MQELKPCPFCGSDGDYVHDGYLDNLVNCSNKGCPLWVTAVGMTEKDWNTRAQPAPADEQVQVEREDLEAWAEAFDRLGGERHAANIRAALQGEKNER